MAALTGSLKRRVPAAGVLATRPHITRLLIHLGFQPERVMRTRWAQTHDPNAFNPHTQRRRRRYRALALEIRTDRTENHVEAVALNVTWQRVKRLFSRKGIVM